MFKCQMSVWLNFCRSAPLEFLRSFLFIVFKKICRCFLSRKLYIDHWPQWYISNQSSKVWPNWRHDCPPLDTGHCTGYCKHVHCWTLDSVLDVQLPRWMLDISRQGPQIVWRAQLGKDPTKTHRNIQIFYPFHKDFLCHKLTNNFWQLTYVFDNSNAEPLKSSTNREACIEQTATNEETLEVEYLTGQLCAFYPIQNTLKLSVFNCWS